MLLWRFAFVVCDDKKKKKKRGGAPFVIKNFSGRVLRVCFCVVLFVLDKKYNEKKKKSFFGVSGFGFVKKKKKKKKKRGQLPAE